MRELRSRSEEEVRDQPHAGVAYARGARPAGGGAVLDATEVSARQPRSYDRRQVGEDRAHVAELFAEMQRSPSGVATGTGDG